MKAITLEKALHMIQVLEMEKAEAVLKSKRLALKLSFLEQQHKKLREAFHGVSPVIASKEKGLTSCEINP